MKQKRKIAIRDIYQDGEHIYEDQLGWQANEKKAANSLISKEIFDALIVKSALNLSFYYIDNDTFYGIHSENIPIVVKKTISGYIR